MYMDDLVQDTKRIRLPVAKHRKSEDSAEDTFIESTSRKVLFSIVLLYNAIAVSTFTCRKKVID